MKAVLIHPDDTVAVALEPLARGERVPVGDDTILLADPVPFGHKFAIRDIGPDERIVKYGEAFGMSRQPIKKGQHVHVHNVRTINLDGFNYTYDYNDKAVSPGASDMTFMGYPRANGEAGIRNYIAIIPLVFCANGPCEKLGRMLSLKYPNTDNFDGFQVLSHGSGCSQSGDDLALTSRVLSNIARNANFGGVLFVSLGCEINDFKQMMPFIGEHDPERVKFMVLQDVDDEYETGMRLAGELHAVVTREHRRPVNIRALHIGYNCGGSDGFSGITANRLVGAVNDRLIALGATTNLTEVPEMFGAEHILMNRARDKATFEKVVKMIKDYKDYFKRYGESPEDNPTQGNLEGGLTNLADKSLGCIQKGGRAVVADVVQHGDRVTQPGFNLVVGPGNDLAGITGQVAAGAVLIIFTTGRGTPCGFIGPTFRLATNNALFAKKPGWNDFNAGRMLGGEDPAALADELFDQIMACCEGRYRTKNEINGFYMMGIFKDGVID